MPPSVEERGRAWIDERGKLEQAHRDAAAVHREAQTRLKFAHSELDQLSEELRKRPDHAHRQVDALADRATELFTAELAGGSWLGRIATGAHEVAPLPPDELAQLHLLASGSGYVTRLHEAIDAIAEDSGNPLFSNRDPADIEAARDGLRRDIRTLEREEAEAREAMVKAAAQLRAWKFEGKVK
jgi:hypothetical protein